jgi:hypothetical protein
MCGESFTAEAPVLLWRAEGSCLKCLLVLFGMLLIEQGNRGVSATTRT